MKIFKSVRKLIAKFVCGYCDYWMLTLRQELEYVDDSIEREKRLNTEYEKYYYRHEKWSKYLNN